MNRRIAAQGQLELAASTRKSRVCRLGTRPAITEDAGEALGHGHRAANLDELHTPFRISRGHLSDECGLKVGEHIAGRHACPGWVTKLAGDGVNGHLCLREVPGRR